MSRAYTIAPSLLAADFLQIGSEIDQIIAAGADELHLDVMDGHFVPNLSFGPPLIKTIKAHKPIPLDVHIMVSNPDSTAQAYVDAGADSLSFHIEAAQHPLALVQRIKAAGIKAGVAISPNTPLARLQPLLSVIDKVLVMSVEPGFGGQGYIASSTRKIADLAALLRSHHLESRIIIGVDGGISKDTIGLAAQHGARAFVVGSFIFAAHDRRIAMQMLRSEVEAKLPT